MPQLEQVDTFLSQIVWLAITFGLLYLLLWRTALPRIADILQQRQDRIDDDLQRAEALKREAEAVLESYDAALVGARAEALDILRESAERTAQEAASRHDELARRIEEEGQAATARIDTMRREALADLRPVAGDAARAALRRLTGVEVSAAGAQAAADAALEEGR